MVKFKLNTSLKIHSQWDYIGFSFQKKKKDLRLAVETTKRILMKEQIDRQLVCQSSPTYFMNIRDEYNSKKVATFDTQDI